jgi:hypothetical protein
MKRKERKKRDVKKRRRRERDSICNSQIDFILCLTTYKQGSNPTAEIENWVIVSKRFFDISSKHILPTES